MRVAMWSGPRNLSTAMMYAFAQRADFEVVDEPFYGPYLRLTGLDHPMREQILASRPEDAFEVEQSLIGSFKDGKPHVYRVPVSAVGRRDQAYGHGSVAARFRRLSLHLRLRCL